MNVRNKTLVVLVLALAVGFADAKGGASSGGGHSSGGGGHSSASSAGSRGGFSSAPASRPAPAPTATPAPSAAPRPAAPAQTTTTTTTRTVNTSSRNISSAGSYGGMGPGYYHNDGLLTGLIIGNMMHPQNTVVYAGGGAHNGNALLYPDGRVVNNQGQQVGTYQNGQFTETPNGPVVAQPIPQSALQPVEKETSVLQWIGIFTLIVIAVFLLLILIGML